MSSFVMLSLRPLVWTCSYILIVSVHLCLIPCYTVRFYALWGEVQSRSCSRVWPTLRWGLSGIFWSTVLMWFLCSGRAETPKCSYLLPPALFALWWFCFPFSIYYLNKLQVVLPCAFTSHPSAWHGTFPMDFWGPLFSLLLPLQCLTTQTLAKLRSLLLGLGEIPLFCLGSGFLCPGWEVVL